MTLYAEVERAVDDHEREVRPFSMSARRARTLLDQLAQAEARAMKAEWEYFHGKDIRPDNDDDLLCPFCNFNDDEHSWSFADWLTAAKERLRGE